MNDCKIEEIGRHAGDLQYLAHGKPVICKIIIDKADDSLINCLCDCAYNILKENIKLPKKDLKKLKKYRRKLHNLCSHKSSIKRKKKFLQTGGLLPALLAPLLPAVLPMLSKTLLGN